MPPKKTKPAAEPKPESKLVQDLRAFLASDHGFFMLCHGEADELVRYAEEANGK